MPPAAKKQGMNEESVAPADDKERSAVAVRKPPGAPGMPGRQGAGQKISRPSSDGFRVGQRPLGPPPNARAWNSQRGERHAWIAQGRRLGLGQGQGWGWGLGLGIG